MSKLCARALRSAPSQADSKAVAEPLALNCEVLQWGMLLCPSRSIQEILCARALRSMPSQAGAG